MRDDDVPTTDRVTVDAVGKATEALERDDATATG